MAELIDGKALAKEVRAEVKARAKAFKATHNRSPGLDVVLVGDDPASQVYVRNKERAAANAGIKGRVHRLPAETSEADLLALIFELNGDDEIDGILVQLRSPITFMIKRSSMRSTRPKTLTVYIHSTRVCSWWVERASAPARRAAACACSSASAAIPTASAL